MKSLVPITLLGKLALIALVGVQGLGVAVAGDSLRELGDVLQVALPVIGGGSTFFTDPDPDARWDRQGTRQFARAYGTAWVTTYALKGIAAKMRPNGENRTSFPSGHTMSAFTGAAFIDGRYGWKFGAPAYALAALTGVSRIQSSWHYADDVVAGASIGLIANWQFTTPQTGAVQIIPTVGAAGVGLAATITPGAGGADPARPTATRGGPGYAFAFGPAAVVRNEVQSRSDRGDRFDLADFEGTGDPVTTAQANVLLPVGARGLLWLSYAPFEAKDFGRFDADTRFGGEVFTADQRIESGWRLHDLCALYGHEILHGRRIAVRLGAGLTAQSSFARLLADDGTVASVKDTRIYPLLDATVSWQAAPRLVLDIQGKGIARGDEHLLSARTGISWWLSGDWDFGLHYVYYVRRIVTDEIYNDAVYNVAHVALTRWWH